MTTEKQRPHDKVGIIAFGITMFIVALGLALVTSHHCQDWEVWDRDLRMCIMKCPPTECI